jgi:hypothetical protein
MTRITLVRLIVACAILIVLGAGMAIVARNAAAPAGATPAGFVH